MVHERHPVVADVILRAMALRSEAPTIEATNQSVENLLAVGYEVPTWELLMTNTNVPLADVEEPTNLGWCGKRQLLVQWKLLSCTGCSPLCLIPKLLC